jgi:hypothetical protein
VIVGRKAAAGSLCILAFLVVAWWIALHASESFRAAFVLPGEWDRFRPFVYADAGLAVLTLLAGVRGFGSNLSPAVAGLAAGAWGYATLWSIGALFGGSLPALGTMLMVVAMGIVGVACHALVSTGRADRR